MDQKKEYHLESIAESEQVSPSHSDVHSPLWLSTWFSRPRGVNIIWRGKQREPLEPISRAFGGTTWFTARQETRD